MRTKNCPNPKNQRAGTGNANPKLIWEQKHSEKLMSPEECGDVTVTYVKNSSQNERMKS